MTDDAFNEEEIDPDAPADAEIHPTDQVGTIKFFTDIDLMINVELGRANATIGDVLRLKKGQVMEVDKLSGEPLDVRVNGRLVARGEAVIVNEKFGVRVTQIVAPDGEEELV